MHKALNLILSTGENHKNKHKSHFLLCFREKSHLKYFNALGASGSILAIQEAEIRRIMAQSQPRQIVP
jgi:hypothetical protein